MLVHPVRGCAHDSDGRCELKLGSFRYHVQDTPRVRRLVDGQVRTSVMSTPSLSAARDSAFPHGPSPSPLPAKLRRVPWDTRNSWSETPSPKAPSASGKASYTLGLKWVDEMLTGPYALSKPIEINF